MSEPIKPEFIRVLTDPFEVQEANYAAHEDFLYRLDKHARRDLVSDALLERWYRKRPPVDRETAIERDYGPAESTRLVR